MLDPIAFLSDNFFDIFGLVTVAFGFVIAWFSFLRERYRMMMGKSDYHIVSITSIREEMVYTSALQEEYLQTVFKPMDKDVTKASAKVRANFEGGVPKHDVNEILKFDDPDVQRSVNAIIGNRVSSLFSHITANDFLSCYDAANRSRTTVYAVVTNEVLPKLHYERVRTILFDEPFINAVLRAMEEVEKGGISKLDNRQLLIEKVQDKFNYFPNRRIDSNRIKLAIELIELLDKYEHKSEVELRENPPPYVKLNYFAVN